MIKAIAAANRHPTNRTLEDFRLYWAEHHGSLGRYIPHLQRYVQHITLVEAYGGIPTPTHDGVSMFWYATLDDVVHPPRRRGSWRRSRKHTMRHTTGSSRRGATPTRQH